MRPTRAKADRRTAPRHLPFVPALVEWFLENQRSLPWRVTYDPYEVWVSEVMLQQTQVETALPYYERFVGRFSTVARLAAAEEQDVLKLWAGLGYYSRARNLLSAARRVVDEHGGVVPSDYDELRALPGVGPYMAGAILSIAFNKPYPVVDGNVRRVLSRINGWTEENSANLWSAAADLVQNAEPRLANQAIMELGAKVCSFRAPRCLICPLQNTCVAFKTGMQDRIPAVRKRPQTVHIHFFAVVCERKGRFLMKESRGLWEFPTFAELPPGDLQRVGACRHTITHHRIDVTVFTGRLKQTSELEWQDPAAIPLSSLTQKILSTAASPQDIFSS
jgi:A/G-specific adenine glycosylase